MANDVAPPASPPLPPRSRWRRRLLIAGLLLALLVIFHAPLLRLTAGLLVVDDPLEPADTVVVSGQSGPYVAVPLDELADLYRQGLVRQVLLIEDRSSRIVGAGVVPTIETVLRRELPKRGVPEEKLIVLAGKDGAPWDGVRRLRDWLDERPGERIIMLCDELSSRETAHVAHSVLTAAAREFNRPEQAERLRFRAVPDKRYQADNWWHSRQGTLRVLGAHVSLLYTYVAGEPPEIERWDADRYLQTLQAAR